MRFPKRLWICRLSSASARARASSSSASAELASRPRTSARPRSSPSAAYSARLCSTSRVPCSKSPTMKTSPPWAGGHARAGLSGCPQLSRRARRASSSLRTGREQPRTSRVRSRSGDQLRHRRVRSSRRAPCGSCPAHARQCPARPSLRRPGGSARRGVVGLVRRHRTYRIALLRTLGSSRASGSGRRRPLSAGSSRRGRRGRRAWHLRLLLPPPERTCPRKWRGARTLDRAPPAGGHSSTRSSPGESRCRPGASTAPRQERRRRFAA